MIESLASDIRYSLRTLSRHPAVAPHVIWRTDALRWDDDPKGPAILSVVAAGGAYEAFVTTNHAAVARDQRFRREGYQYY
jgi:hypothetical protein